MSSKIQQFGEGLRIDSSTTYINGENVDVDVINVDLSGSAYVASKISLDNIDTNMGMPGQILTINHLGQPEWTTPSIANDKALREEYPSLKIAWDNVMEALDEYEMVKKLVQDYDK